MKFTRSFFSLAVISATLVTVGCGQRGGSAVSTTGGSSESSPLSQPAGTPAASLTEVVPKTITAANVLKLVDEIDVKIKKKIVFLAKDNGLDISQRFQSALNSVGSDGRVIGLLDSTEAYCELNKIKNCGLAMKKALTVSMLTDKLVKSCGSRCTKESKGIAFALIDHAFEYRKALGVKSSFPKKKSKTGNSKPKAKAAVLPEPQPKPAVENDQPRATHLGPVADDGSSNDQGMDFLPKF